MMSTEDIDDVGDSFVVLGTSSPSPSLQQSMAALSLRPDQDDLIYPDDVHSIVSDCCRSHASMSELVQENNALRDLLRKNSMSIREQFRAVEAWHNDIMETHRVHREKFAETKELIKKLKSENATLKSELEIAKGSLNRQNALEYHKQANGELLNMQMDQLKENVNAVKAENEQLMQEKKEIEDAFIAIKAEFDNLIQERANQDASTSSHNKEITDLKVKLMAAENVKLAFTKYKQDADNSMRAFTIEIQDLRTKLRDALQMVLLAPDLEFVGDNEDKIVYYGNIVKDLPKIINFYTNQLCMLAMRISHLHNTFNMGNDVTCAMAKQEINLVHNSLSNNHVLIAEHNSKIKEYLGFMEKMLADYQDIWKQLKEANNKLVAEDETNNCHKNQLMEYQNQLISNKETIWAKDKELRALREIVENLQKESDERDHLRAQLESYRSDFEMERDARTELAGAKEKLIEQLRLLQEEWKRKFDTQRPEEFEFTGENSNPYMCPVCQNNFRTVDALEQHVEVCLDNNQ